MVTEQHLNDAIAVKVLESNCLYIIVTDLNGKFTYLNNYFCQHFKVNAHRSIGRDAIRHIARVDKARCLKMVSNCIKQPGKSISGKLRKPSDKQGEFIPTFWELKAIPDSNGRPVQILCIGYDLSQHRKIEKELQFKSKLLDTIGQAAIAFDLQETITYWNKAAENIYGYTKAEMLGERVYVTVHQKDPAQLSEAWAALKEGKQWTGEQLHRDKYGRVFPVKVTDSPLYDESGNMIGVIAISEDISKEKDNQESIKLHKEQLGKLMQNVPGAVFQMELTPNGKLFFPYISREINRLHYKLTPEVLRESAEPAFEAVHDDDVPRLKEAIENGIRGDLSELKMEYRIKSETPGAYRWNRLRARPEFNEDGGLTWYGIFEDVTDQKNTLFEHNKLLNTATNQNKRLKDFSFMVSHNIRSSVANIMGLLGMVRSDPSNEEYLEMMDLTVNRLNNTLSNVSELLNFEQSMDMTSWVPCSLLQTVTRVIELNNEVIFRRGIQFLVGVPEDLLVYSVPAYLDSIFHNLITNAIKYGTTNKKKTIDIIGVKEEGRVVVRIRDYGIGIDLERHGDKIFKLGGRLHQDSRGEGLGLFMTKHQIEALGGKIEVESEENFGSTFIVTFEQ